MSKQITLNTEFVAEAIKNGVTYSHQTGSVVIHGAIDVILKQHYASLDHLDNQFNAVIDCINTLSKAGCRHDLHVINEWVDKYTHDDGTIDWRKILTEKKLI